MRIGTGGELGLKALVSLPVIKSGGAIPCFNLHQHCRQITIGCRTRYQGHVGGALEDLLALLLCHASEDSKNLALRLVFLVVREPVEDLLLRFVAD